MANTRTRERGPQGRERMEVPQRLRALDPSSLSDLRMTQHMREAQVLTERKIKFHDYAKKAQAIEDAHESLGELNAAYLNDQGISDRDPHFGDYLDYLATYSVNNMSDDEWENPSYVDLPAEDIDGVVYAPYQGDAPSGREQAGEQFARLVTAYNAEAKALRDRNGTQARRSAGVSEEDPDPDYVPRRAMRAEPQTNTADPFDPDGPVDPDDMYRLYTRPDGSRTSARHPDSFASPSPDSLDTATLNRADFHGSDDDTEVSNDVFAGGDDSEPDVESDDGNNNPGKKTSWLRNPLEKGKDAYAWAGAKYSTFMNRINSMPERFDGKPTRAEKVKMALGITGAAALVIYNIHHGIDTGIDAASAGHAGGNHFGDFGNRIGHGGGKVIEAFKDLGIPEKYTDQVVQEVGEKLSRIHYDTGEPVAVFDKKTGDWHLNEFPKVDLPQEAVDLFEDVKESHFWAVKDDHPFKS